MVLGDLEDCGCQAAASAVGSALREECVKCSQQANVVLPSQRIYCKICFIESSTRRFLTFMRRNKSALNNQRVMIAYSGGMSSGVLLDFVYKDYSKYKKTKYVFDPVIVYISFDERMDTEMIEKYLSSLNIEYHILKKEQKNHENIDDLLADVAQKLNISTIFVGYNSSHLATLGILNMAKLESSSKLMSLMHSSYIHENGVRIMKPLKDFIGKEIACNYIIKNIENMSRFDFNNNLLPINNLLYRKTTNFLNRLQIKNECTLSTINRTFEKLDDT